MEANELRPELAARRSYMIYYDGAMSSNGDPLVIKQNELLSAHSSIIKRPCLLISTGLQLEGV